MTSFLLDEDDGRYPRHSRLREPKFIFLLIVTLFLGGSTLAANVNLNSGKSIEFGQGVFRVAACDGFISVYLWPTAATYNGLSRVQTVEIVGLNPQQCTNKVLKFKFYGSTNNLLNMYVGPVLYSTADTNTVTQKIDSATTITVFDTATAYSGGTYSTWASKALTLIDQTGVNIGYYNDYLSISYNKTSGSYKIYMVQPLCLMNDVYNITVETAPLITS